MKRILVVLGIASALFLQVAPSFAMGRIAPPDGNGGNTRLVTLDPPTRVAAPEIDVASGSKAIALLVAGLLLAAEGLRRRR
jgi:hypothetical protein